MKRHIWSLVFSLFQFFLAILLFVFGQREYLSLGRPPWTAYQSIPGYIPAAQKVSYCLNIPSMVATAPLRHWLYGYLSVGQYQVSYDQIGYCIMVFLCWWWVGSRFDYVWLGTAPPLSRFRTLTTVAHVVGCLFSILLLYAAATGLFGTFSGGKAILISMLLWGVVLLYHFGTHFMRGSLGGRRVSSDQPSR